MRALLQRVSQAAVEVDGQKIASIGTGLLVLLGIAPADTEADAAKLVGKLSRLRVFEDGDGKTNLSLADVGGSLLVVSQFTLYANCKKGNRPSFTAAARPEVAVPLYERFLELAAQTGIPVACGEFGALMHVSLVNDGPFTVLLDTDEL